MKIMLLCRNKVGGALGVQWAAELLWSIIQRHPGVAIFSIIISLVHFGLD
jgi:hypothetical protein